MIKSNQNSSYFLKQIIFYSFIILFTILIIKAFLISKSFSTYVFQEWMINYSQGFIRRGLTGTFWFLLHDIYKINIYIYIVGFSYLTFILFSSIYIWKVKKSLKFLNWESLIVVLFLPSLILFPLKDLSVIGRKEFYFFFGSIINLFLVSKTIKNLNINKEQQNFLENNQDATLTINKYCYNLFIWYNLISIPTTLTHEGIIFLSLPLNIIITASLIRLVFPVKQVLWRTLIIYAPIIVIAMICLLIPKDENLASGICQSWQEYSHIYEKLSMDCNPSKLIGVLKYYNLSIKDAIKEVLKVNLSGITILNWMIVFTLNIILLIRNSFNILQNSLSSHLKSEQNDSAKVIFIFILKYLFLPFIASFLLYIIALDWGRWFFILSISYVLCLLTPNLIKLETLSYHQNQWILNICTPIYLIYLKLIDFFQKISSSKLFFPIYGVIFIYTLFFIRIPHYNLKTKDLYDFLPNDFYHALVAICKTFLNLIISVTIS